MSGYAIKATRERYRSGVRRTLSGQGRLAIVEQHFVTDASGEHVIHLLKPG
jgi:hypothetical protein